MLFALFRTRLFVNGDEYSILHDGVAFQEYPN